jgi:hypothetical protein
LKAGYDDEMKTRDIDIRNVLHRELCIEYGHDPDTLILDELGLCQGEARVDVAVVNGAIHGYEIKSESDTLERLPNQVDIYGKVLDTVTIVTASRHLEGVYDLIPKWWGVYQTQTFEDKIIELQEIRPCQLNPNIDPYSLVQLLWRDEALDLLKRFNLEKGFLSKGRKVIWRRLAASVPLDILKDEVRHKLKERRNWRVGSPLE